MPRDQHVSPDFFPHGASPHVCRGGKRALRKALSAAAAVLFLSGTLGGCGDEKRLVQLTQDGYRQDVFSQEAASQLDLLWVIDNSASMEPHQARLAAGLSRFMSFLDRGGVDYRIAVTTTDARTDTGRFLGTPSIVSPSLADPASAFARNIRVGISGSGHEEAFEAARLAIERESKSAETVLQKRADCINACGTSQTCADKCRESNTPAFMRPSAHLHLIFVSDEEEQSVGEVRYFQRVFESALGLGNEGSVRTAAICGLSSADSCAKSAGTRYIALAGSTGGVIASVCDDNFEGELSDIAHDAAGLKRRFALHTAALPETVAVRVLYRCDADPADLGTCGERTENCAGAAGSTYGIVCTPPSDTEDGWTFDEKAGAVLFHGPALPGIRSRIEVSYTADPDALSPR